MRTLLTDAEQQYDVQRDRLHGPEAGARPAWPLRNDGRDRRRQQAKRQLDDGNY